MNPERDDLTPIDQALAAANERMATQANRNRVVDAALAARAAYHVCVINDPTLLPMPPEVAIHIAQMAFATTWNASAQG